MLYQDTVVLVYAKAPVAGKVNTRLIPDIGEAAATALQEELIHRRLHQLTSAKLCDVVLMTALDKSHRCFTECQQRYVITLREQTGVGLGQRILNGVSWALLHYQRCIVVGTDAPALDVEVIRQAIDSLASDPVVFVPAEDGGYVLLGLTQVYSFLFENIRWGSDRVMQQSRTRLQEKQVSFKELETCWDVDRLEDYRRYRKTCTRPCSS